MSTIPRLLEGSASLEDGFAGAQDASLLGRYDHDREIGVVHVQATAGTRGLLRRAGYARTFLHGFYAVRVEEDGFGRLQIHRKGGRL